jgi:GNAT superfamily N-acetyltransferase
MGDPTARSEPQLRTYERADEPAVVALLGSVLRGWRLRDATARFRWKHEDGPFGPSRGTVAVLDGEVVGFYATLPWRFVLDGRVVTASRAMDGAVAPHAQRRGIGRAFGATEERDAQARAQDVHVNHSNVKTEGIKRQFDYPEGAHPPVHRAPIRPLRLARWRLRGDGPAATHRPLEPIDDVLADTDAVEDLLARSVPAGRLVTDRSVTYLRWRYGAFPDRTYEAASLRGADGRLRGLLFGWLAPTDVEAGAAGHFEVSEVIVPEHDRAAMRALLRRVYGTRAPSAAALLPVPLTRADAWRAGFPLVRRHTWHFSARALADGLPDDISDWRRWELSLGELTTF